MLHLLPVPKEMKLTADTFTLREDLYIVLSPDARQMLLAAEMLRDEIAAACGFQPRITCGSTRAGDIALGFMQGEPQSYELHITRERVTLSSGGDSAGLLHAVQTLRQIIRQRGRTLPTLEIQDAPDFPVRGFYYDQTRGRIDTLEGLKRLADDMCFCKLNQLQLYIEHTYLYRDIPELWPIAGMPLTAEDIMDLDDYCAARGIELVPSLSTFGHLCELLKLPRLSDLCELENPTDYRAVMFDRMGHHTINPEDDRAFQLIAAMIDEFLPLFHSKKFNICADETFDLGRGKNAGKDVTALYMGFLKKLCAHVQQRGSTPMFWGDIVLEHPEALTELPEGAICLNWGYSPTVTEDGTRAFAGAGAVQYVCPGTHSWDWWLPRMAAAYENICRMADHGRKYGAQGFLNTNWGDYGHVCDPRFSLPGMMAGACASWGVMPEEEALLTALSHIVYGDPEGRVLHAVRQISEGQMYTWRHVVDHMEWSLGRLPLEASPLPAIAEERLRLADAAIEAALRSLNESTDRLPTCQRSMIHRWQVAAEAICIWNHAQYRTANGQKDAALAESMVRWWPQYEAMWRETSRESELWRIRDVVMWYAAQLR